MRVKLCLLLNVVALGLLALPAVAVPGRSGPSFTFAVVAGSSRAGNTSSAGLSGHDVPAFEVVESALTVDGTASQWAQAAQHAVSLRPGAPTFYAVPSAPDALHSAVGMSAFRTVYGTRYRGPNYRSFDYEGVHFILLDSTVLGHSFGHLGTIEENWLAGDLKHLRPSTPVFVFLYHDVGVGNAITRPLDDEYDLRAMMRGHNVCAIFCGQPHSPDRWKTDGILTIAPPSTTNEQVTEVSIDRSLITLRQRGVDQPEPAATSIPLVEAMQSVLQVGWNDPNNPYLARRRVAALLDPRSPSDSADGETARMRIDDMPWMPMTQDIRNIWKRVFFPQSVPVGVHVCDVEITTSNHEMLGGELIFEVERSHTEATRAWAVNLNDGIVTNPIIDGNKLFITSLDHHCYCINRATGKARWSVNVGAQCVSAPVVMGGTLYVGSLSGTLFALDKQSGERRWSYDTRAEIRSAPAIADDVVAVASGTSIVGLSVETGKPVWQDLVDGFCAGHLVANHGVVFVRTSAGTVYAMRAGTGAVIWKTSLGSSGYGTAARCLLTVGERQVYAVSGDGVLFAINETTGAVLWHRAAPAADEPYRSTPVVLGLSIYVAGAGSDGDVYSVSTVDGSVQWVQGIGQEINGSAPVLAPDGRSLAIMGGRGGVAVLDTGTGHIAWRYSLGPGNIVSSPAYDGEHLYTTTMADDVQCINGPGVGAPAPILPHW